MSSDLGDRASSDDGEPGRAARARNRLMDATLRQQSLDGFHVPSAEQLLRGFPFTSDDMREDARQFALSLLEWASGLPGGPLRTRLEAVLPKLAESCSARTVRAVANVLRSTGGQARHPELLAADLRCRIYLAHLGSEAAAMSVATDTIMTAYLQDWSVEGDGSDVVWQCLGWLAQCAYAQAAREAGQPSPPDGAMPIRVRKVAAEFEARVRRCVLEIADRR